jgi:hypothetical protein
MADEGEIPSNVNLQIGFVRDILEVGQTGSDLGFHAFSFCTRSSFRLLRNCLETPADVVDSMFGGNEISTTLRNVHTTVDAAEVIAMTSILMAHTATNIGFTAADITLEIGSGGAGGGGGVPRSENSLWQQIRTAIPSRYSEYTPFIHRIAQMVLTFVLPIREIPPTRLRQILVAFALLQQANRSFLIPLSLRSIRRVEGFVLPSDLVRCMGFAAAAYGHLTVNCLEFIPRGLYQSDILPLLVPGVSQSDVISQQEVVNPFCIGYLLTWDHRDRHIVLSLRGSLNLNDVITDLTCQSVDCSTLFTHLAPPPHPSSCSSSYGERESEEQRLSDEDLVCVTHEGRPPTLSNLDPVPPSCISH